MAKIIGIAARMRDLPAEKFVEEKFRLAVEACPSGMVMTDNAGKIVLANTAAERLFGYQRGELIGRPIEILVPERLHSEYLKHRASFMSRPETHRNGASHDLSGLCRDGTELPVEITLNPIRTPESFLVLSVIVDISERKRVDRLKDEFVSTVSHELRTPLTSIAGSLGLLVGGAAGKLPGPALRLLTIAQNNSQRLVRLINDILDMEKIESGQTAFNFKRVDQRLLVEQAIEANRGYAEGFGVPVRLAPGPPVGDVYADPDRLAQVVTNLLSNAIKFSPPGSEVTVAIEQHTDMVRICVRDHGPGIRDEFKPRIFERFAQADATDARQKGGTGLGLSIVKQIVTRLGGKVGFDDAPGGGTIFYVELPGWDQIAAGEIDAERGAEAVRILLCEDDPDAAAALRESLRPLGFSTDFAHTAADALMRAKQDCYAAILVDFELPEADGIAFIRHLREQPENYKTPIVVMSAGGSRGKSEAAKYDLCDWLDKPVDVDHLAQILDGAAAHGTNWRPRILHVDDDHDMLDMVAHALASTAIVVSVDSIDDARRELMARHFDLAVLDISVGEACGLDLLPQLRSRDGTPIPVVIFSAHGAELAPNPQVEANLSKSRAALDALVAAVHDRLTLSASHSREEMA